MSLDTSLDLQAIARELLSFVHTKNFLHLFVAQYTADFLGFKSGELNTQLTEIERHSGHHSAILNPIPALLAKLENLSADATSTANIVSYYKIMISHLADELLQHLEDACGEENGQSIDVKQQIMYLRQRIKSLSMYMIYLERRAERQITATLHLVNQANAATNLAVAHDTKILAIASKSDSFVNENTSCPHNCLSSWCLCGRALLNEHV
jgi:hypothetical protein